MLFYGYLKKQSQSGNQILHFIQNDKILNFSVCSVAGKKKQSQSTPGAFCGLRAEVCETKTIVFVLRRKYCVFELEKQSQFDVHSTPCKNSWPCLNFVTFVNSFG